MALYEVDDVVLVNILHLHTVTAKITGRKRSLDTQWYYEIQYVIKNNLNYVSRNYVTTNFVQGVDIVGKTTITEDILYLWVDHGLI